MKTMLNPHLRANLEYWFFKVNNDRVALLVDWIAKRKMGKGVLRVSIHSSVGKEVLFDELPNLVTGNDSPLSLDHTKGHLGPITWQLSMQANRESLRPSVFPASQLRLFDMTLVSVPIIFFDGWIRHGREEYKLTQNLGMVSHYWGRRLPSEWWWVSANQFDQEGVTLECMVVRSRLWGTPIKVQIGYFFFLYYDKRNWLMTPPARANVRGSFEGFEIEFKRFGKPRFRVIGRTREYCDLGDNILNTLVGDLEVWHKGHLIAKSEGRAGIEQRK